MAVNFAYVPSTSTGTTVVATMRGCICNCGCNYHSQCAEYCGDCWLDCRAMGTDWAHLDPSWRQPTSRVELEDLLSLPSCDSCGGEGHTAVAHER